MMNEVEIAPPSVSSNTVTIENQIVNAIENNQLEVLKNLLEQNESIFSKGVKSRDNLVKDIIYNNHNKNDMVPFEVACTSGTKDSIGWLLDKTAHYIDKNKPNNLTHINQLHCFKIFDGYEILVRVCLNEKLSYYDKFIVIKMIMQTCGWNETSLNYLYDQNVGYGILNNDIVSRLFFQLNGKNLRDETVAPPTEHSENLLFKLPYFSQIESAVKKTDSNTNQKSNVLRKRSQKKVAARSTYQKKMPTTTNTSPITQNPIPLSPATAPIIPPVHSNNNQVPNPFTSTSIKTTDQSLKPPSTSSANFSWADDDDDEENDGSSCLQEIESEIIENDNKDKQNESIEKNIEQAPLLGAHQNNIYNEKRVIDKNAQEEFLNNIKRGNWSEKRTNDYIERSKISLIVPDSQGKYPLQIALEHGNYAVVKYLDETLKTKYPDFFKIQWSKIDSASAIDFLSQQKMESLKRNTVSDMSNWFAVNSKNSMAAEYDKIMMSQYKSQQGTIPSYWEYSDWQNRAQCTLNDLAAEKNKPLDKVGMKFFKITKNQKQKETVTLLLPHVEKHHKVIEKINALLDELIMLVKERTSHAAEKNNENTTQTPKI